MIIKKDKDLIIDYLKDASNTEGFCDSVYFPESVNDLQEIFREAAENGTQVTISGNRTGLTGAAVPKGGIVISTERLNKIIEINRDELTKYSKNYYFYLKTTEGTIPIQIPVDKCEK